jgi:hypothetical protein
LKIYNRFAKGDSSNKNGVKSLNLTDETKVLGSKLRVDENERIGDRYEIMKLIQASSVPGSLFPKITGDSKMFSCPGAKRSFDRLPVWMGFIR